MGSGKLALVAGEGTLPLFILRNLLARGERPLVYALRADYSELDLPGATLLPVKDVNLVKIFASFALRRVKRVLLAGYVPKTMIYGSSLDREADSLVSGLADRNDHALLGAVIQRLEKLGILVLGYESVVPEMIVPLGTVAGPEPSSADLEDVEYGRKILGRLLPLSFGQSLVVSKCAVVAVEAMEGTDRTIRRAGGIVPSGVLVKGMRSDQDRRFDIPVVGGDTLRVMAEAGLSCMAIEAGNGLIVEREYFVSLANELGISVIGVEPCPSS
ncbi:MAG: hypothetical protein CSA35_02960 [Dethiosulfovibrio peptidovorans]|nr:MAG: hypothetical protein CSA35_02960 [Dethiosulfovibrio peptidovorans]